MPVCVLWNWSWVEGGTTLVLHDLRTYYTLHWVRVITSGTLDACDHKRNSSLTGWNWGVAT